MSVATTKVKKVTRDLNILREVQHLMFSGQTFDRLADLTAKEL